MHFLGKCQYVYCLHIIIHEIYLIFQSGSLLNLQYLMFYFCSFWELMSCVIWHFAIWHCVIECQGNGVLKMLLNTHAKRHRIWEELNPSCIMYVYIYIYIYIYTFLYIFYVILKKFFMNLKQKLLIKPALISLLWCVTSWVRTMASLHQMHCTGPH
jgi:hypothetical protein